MLKHGAWMVKDLNKALEDVISVIMKSDDYQTCLKLKEKMKKNKELMELIEKLKLEQKDFVKNGYQNKDKINELEKKLYQIPIYAIYIQHLEKVNDMLSYVEDDLNHYFYQLFN